MAESPNAALSSNTCHHSIAIPSEETSSHGIDCCRPQTSLSETLLSVRHQLQVNVRQEHLKLNEALKLNSAKLKTLHMLKKERSLLQKHIESERKKRIVTGPGMHRTEAIETELRDLQLTVNQQDYMLHSLKRHAHELKCKSGHKLKIKSQD